MRLQFVLFKRPNPQQLNIPNETPIFSITTQKLLIKENNNMKILTSSGCNSERNNVVHCGKH